MSHDNETTKEKILDAACTLFSEKGFREVTNAQICDRAGANIAAVNYHFGSKAELYRAVWQKGAARANELYPFGRDCSQDVSAEKRLRCFISALINRRMDENNLGYFHRIRMCEMFDPTGHLTDLMHKEIEKSRVYLVSVIMELLGPGADNLSAALCSMSVISQCLFRPGRFFPCRKRPDFVPEAVPEISIQQMIEHVISFSLAGIEKIRSQRGMSQNNENIKKGSDKDE